MSGMDNGVKITSDDNLAGILKAAAYRGSNLMKLKLSKMNLRNEYIVSLIKETIFIAQNLISLDLSWSQLCPKELLVISSGLAESAKSMRNLNLSYNQLNFEEEGQQKEDSKRFMKHIEDFFEIAQFLNHINFSGMGFKDS